MEKKKKGAQGFADLKQLFFPKTKNQNNTCVFVGKNNNTVCAFD
jgi:hypothetical protein